MQPSKIAIIPDGNRRFSVKTGLTTQQAYLKGFEKAEEAVRWCEDTSVKSLTYWALSLENFQKRSPFELKTLFSLMKQHAKKTLSHPRFKEQDVRIKFFGRLDLLPKDLVAKILELEEKTQDRSGAFMNVALAYSGKDELLQAAKKLALQGAKNPDSLSSMSEETFSNFLYFKESPDLIIRTGDVQRLSGFLPWQAGYSEIYFSKKLWPEFSKDDFKDALSYYETAQRRFGK